MEVNIYCPDSKINSKGKAPLRIHVGSYIKVSLGISVLHKSWNSDKQRVKSGEPFYFAINKKIEKALSKINEYLLENPKPTKEAIESLIKEEQEQEELKKEEEEEEKRLTFYEFWGDFQERHKSDLSHNWLRGFTQVRDWLFKYNPALTYKDVDAKFYSGYIKFMLGNKNRNGRFFSDNSISDHVKRVKIVLKDAAKHGYQVSPDFDKVKRKWIKYKGSRLEWVDVEKMEAIEGLSAREERVRDMFIFRCNTGLRDSDYKSLTQYSFVKRNNQMCLRYNMPKTKQDQFIILNSKALAIAKKYHFELPDCTQQEFNRVIKVVGKLAELNEKVEQIRHSGKRRTSIVSEKWDLISTHTARRTFARRWFDLGGDIRYISHFLGHESEAQTREYIGLDDDDTNQEMIRVFDQQGLH